MSGLKMVPVHTKQGTIGAILELLHPWLDVPDSRAAPAWAIKIAAAVMHADEDKAGPDSVPRDGEWLLASETKMLVRRLDVALNGEEGAAKQASLCDLVGQVEAIARDTGRPALAKRSRRALRGKKGDPLAALIRELLDKGDFYYSAIEQGEFGYSFELWETKAQLALREYEGK